MGLLHQRLRREDVKTVVIWPELVTRESSAIRASLG
jgi:hypothetical protein